MVIIFQYQFLVSPVTKVQLGIKKLKKIKKITQKFGFLKKIMLYLKCEINLNNIIYETINESRRCNCKNNSNH